MTVRLRLTIAIVAVILVANCALSLVTVLYMGQIWLDEVQTRVRLNLGAPEPCTTTGCGKSACF